MVDTMRGEIMSQMTRPEEGERGLGASHRRGGTGRASYRRPPEGLVKALIRVESPTSKAPVAKRKVESMRDKGAKRTADRKLHIDDGCMGGGGSVRFDQEMTETEWNDYYITNFLILPNCQLSNRQHIFHYCIMCYNFKGKYFGKDSSTWWAAGEWGGDKMTINRKCISPSYQAHFFLHELGHNVISDSLANNKASHLNSEAHCINRNCALNNDEYTSIGYCGSCWNAMDLGRWL